MQEREQGKECTRGTGVTMQGGKEGTDSKWNGEETDLRNKEKMG